LPEQRLGASGAAKRYTLICPQASGKMTSHGSGRLG
jgi:hypothetical protein